MSRLAREKSSTGIYHVMLRGIDKRDIFLQDQDKERFLYYLFRARERGGFELYGYCLMSNHVHLLLKEGEELGKSIKRITVAYVQWHNKVYERTGHLFQNRYRSETVEDDMYFIGVLRYIHQNPIKAKMVKNMKDYKWSSYHDYILSYNGEEVIIDTGPIKDYFGSFKSFRNYMMESNDDNRFLEYKAKKPYSDEKLRGLICEKLDIDKIADMPKLERDRIIHDLYQSTGTSIRQLSRVTRIGRGIVQKAVLND